MNDKIPTADSVREQLGRIQNSTEFTHSPRLNEILGFIVEEALSGREKYIKGASIGSALFNQKYGDSASSSAVRVEMGRLRKRLVEYYTGSGQQDPILVSIPKGTYVPSFEFNSDLDQKKAFLTESMGLKRASVRYLTLIVIFLLAGVWIFKELGIDSPRDPENPGYQAIRSSDPEADTLFRQAFVLLMPPEEGLRLASSIELFKRVTEMDPAFPGGYTGHSIALSFQVFFLKSQNPEGDMDLALSLARKSVGLDNNFGLGLAANSLALALSGEQTDAKAMVRKAIGVRPRDPNTNAIASLALITIGEATEAQKLLEESIQLNPKQIRTPYLNMLGATYLILGEYKQAADTLEKNLDAGGPSGSHIDALLAATYAQLGEDLKAQAALDRLSEKDYQFPVEQWIGNFIHSEKRQAEIVGRLRELGYPN